MKSDIQTPSTNTLIQQDDTWQKVTLYLPGVQLVRAQLQKAARKNKKRGERKRKNACGQTFFSLPLAALFFYFFARCFPRCTSTNWKKLLFYCFPTINVSTVLCSHECNWFNRDKYGYLELDFIWIISRLWKYPFRIFKFMFAFCWNGVNIGPTAKVARGPYLNWIGHWSLSRNTS